MYHIAGEEADVQHQTAIPKEEREYLGLKQGSARRAALCLASSAAPTPR